MTRSFQRERNKPSNKTTTLNSVAHGEGADKVAEVMQRKTHEKQVRGWAKAWEEVEGGCLISLQLFVHMERWDRRNLLKWFVGVPPDPNTHFYTSHLCQLLVNTFFRETHPQSSLPPLPPPQWFPWCLSQHGCQVNQGESCQLQRPGPLKGCDVCPSEASGGAKCQTGSAESEGWQRRERKRWGMEREKMGNKERLNGSYNEAWWILRLCQLSH